MPHHSSLIALWRDERLTDFAVCAEGVEFKAHRVALASSSKYFLKLFESGMSAQRWVASSTSSVGAAGCFSLRWRSTTLIRTAGRMG